MDIERVEREYGARAADKEMLLQKITRHEKELQKKITDAKARHRYLTHLVGKKNDERPTCVICLDVYEIGIISNCGHSFCKECTTEWRRTSQGCPICKAKLRPADFFPVSYRPTEIAMQKERLGASKDPSARSNAQGVIYEAVDDRVLREIKSIDLGALSYGSKIDMITRHMIWLKRNEPCFKAVIFSQWKDILEVIKSSLKRYNIGFSSLEPGGIDKFKGDLDTSCFLLHAKSQSAGLTLVNATHVFLCEPLLSVGLELQAISRVHRIGQESPTTVWLYCINNTVEESVLDISTRRRLDFIGKAIDGKADISDATTKQLLVESDELRDGMGKYIDKAPGGGEKVVDEDLWGCLFGSGASSNQPPRRHDMLVARELMAHSAEQRIGVAGPSGSG